MNYLEWKQRILVYMVARGKPIAAIPEELEFYLYSKFKCIDAKSLPTQMAIALPMGISAKKAVDCLALALSTVHLQVQLDDNISAANPLALAATEIEYIGEAELGAIAVDSLTLATEQVHTDITTELSVLGYDRKATIAKFNIQDCELGTVATVCLDTVNAGVLHTMAFVAASALITTISPTLTSGDVNLGDELTIGLTPSEIFMEELVGEIGIDLDNVIDLEVDSVEPVEPESVAVELPSDNITVSAELIRIASAAAEVEARFGLGVKAVCIKRAVIADFVGITIASLEGQTVDSLTYIET